MAGLKFTSVEAVPDGESEQPRVELEPGVFVERRDPYGFWFFETPESKHQNGAFTSQDAAKAAQHRHNVAVKAEVDRIVALEAAKKEQEKLDKAFQAAVKKATAAPVGA